MNRFKNVWYALTGKISLEQTNRLLREIDNNNRDMSNMLQLRTDLQYARAAIKELKDSGAMDYHEAQKRNQRIESNKISEIYINQLLENHRGTN